MIFTGKANTTDGHNKISGLIYYAPDSTHNHSRQFSIGNCGADCSFLIEADEIANLNRVDGIPIPASEVEGRSVREDLTYRATDRQDPGPTATINIMFYYTAQFATTISPDTVQSKVNTIIGQVNAGYINSGLNLRANIFCVEELTSFAESTDPEEMIGRFRQSQFQLGYFLAQP